MCEETSDEGGNVSHLDNLDALRFEDRIKKVIGEVISDGNIILFVDELHTLIGAGGAEGAIDASNILKPSLSRGEIQMIGATTLNEYRKYIEKDAALERRFQPVYVDEPTRDEAVEILKHASGKGQTATVAVGTFVFGGVKAGRSGEAFRACAI